MEQSPVHEIVNPAAGLETRVQLDQRLGPEYLGLQAFLDELVDPPVPDLDEASNVLCVVLDNGSRKRKTSIEGLSVVGDDLHGR